MHQVIRMPRDRVQAGRHPDQARGRRVAARASATRSTSAISSWPRASARSSTAGTTVCVGDARRRPRRSRPRRPAEGAVPAEGAAAALRRRRRCRRAPAAGAAAAAAPAAAGGDKKARRQAKAARSKSPDVARRRARQSGPGVRSDTATTSGSWWSTSWRAAGTCGRLASRSSEARSRKPSEQRRAAEAAGVHERLAGRRCSGPQAFYKVEPSQIVVVHDEIDLPFGMLRVKVGGGHGGHNGLRSIIEQLGDDASSRVRCGVGQARSAARNRSTGHVLGGFSARAEQSELPFLVGGAADAVRAGSSNKGPSPPR